MGPTETLGSRSELFRFQLEQGNVAGSFVIHGQYDIPDRNGRGLKELLDRCYPQPPRDVFERMLDLYKPGDPLYTMEHEEQAVGMVYCARHSKGGHLESLAVDPDYQGLGLAGRLVETLVEDNPGAISLTTRIPAFFARHGFEEIRTMPDQSVYMVRLSTEQQTA